MHQQDNSAPGPKTGQRTSKTVKSPGAWLPWPDVEILCKLSLRRGSHWRVFLTILLTSLRYGRQVARLGISDIARMTGLAPRTVKGALGALRQAGLVTRVGRYKSLKVSLAAGSGNSGGASKRAPRAGKPRATRGASLAAPPKGKLACPSPTCFNVSLNNKSNGSHPFTPKQQALIADLFIEASELLGSDATCLSLTPHHLEQLGLCAPVTYGVAHDQIAKSGTPAQAGIFTRAVHALRHDERVQGRPFSND